MLGGGPGTSPEMSEYLRRAAMAQRDGDFLMGELKRRFPTEPILVVRYGDHQPSATRDLINEVWGDDSPDVGKDGSPGPFITFYAMAGHNFPVPPLPAYDPIGIASAMKSTISFARWLFCARAITATSLWFPRKPMKRSSNSRARSVRISLCRTVRPGWQASGPSSYVAANGVHARTEKEGIIFVPARSRGSRRYSSTSGTTNVPKIFDMSYRTVELKYKSLHGGSERETIASARLHRIRRQSFELVSFLLAGNALVRRNMR